MTLYILRQEFRYLSRFCALGALLIVNFAIFVPNAILYVFNTRTDLDPCDGPPNSVSSEYCWPSKVFAPISATDSAMLDRTLRAFVAAVETASLTYFIYGGTLIGSLRHHGPIPWDDDVDVMFSAGEKNKLIKVLTALRPDFEFFVPNADCRHPQWKFYPIDGYFVTGLKYKTPYIDIFFYQENITHIWCESPAWNMTDVWLKRHIFPLHRRPFGNLSLPAPCNGMVVIGRRKMSKCESRLYNHIKDIPELEWGIVIPCENLTRFYPFVGKSIAAEGPLRDLVKETLMFQNWTLQEITVKQFC